MDSWYWWVPQVQRSSVLRVWSRHTLLLLQREVRSLATLFSISWVTSSVSGDTSRFGLGWLLDFPTGFMWSLRYRERHRFSTRPIVLPFIYDCCLQHRIRFYVFRTETFHALLRRAQRHLLNSAIMVILMGHTAVQTCVVEGFLARSAWLGVVGLKRKSTTVDLAGSEGSDGMKVDNDRLGQLRGLGRHESRPSIDTGLTVFTQIMQVSRLKALSRVVNVYLLSGQLDDKVEKLTFRHSARSSPSNKIFIVVEVEGPFKGRECLPLAATARRESGKIHLPHSARSSTSLTENKQFFYSCRG